MALRLQIEIDMVTPAFEGKAGIEAQRIMREFVGNMAHSSFYNHPGLVAILYDKDSSVVGAVRLVELPEVG